MKRMIGIAVIAVFACALFLVPNASADVNISSNVVPGRGDFESSFTYIATLTNPPEYSWDVTEKVNLTIGPDYNNKSINKLYDLGNIIIPDGESRTISKDVYFTYSALMQGDFKNWTTEGRPCNWTRAWYQFCSKGMFRVDCDGQDRHPILTPPEPKIKLICPGSVAWCEDFIWTVYVDDEVRGSGIFRILVDNETLVNKSKQFPPGGGEYTYKGRPFNESMVCNYYTVVFNYSNFCYDINKSCRGHVAQIPCPKIMAYLGGNPLFEDRENVRYIEENVSLPFKAVIADYVGSANVTLKLDVNKDFHGYFNYSWNQTLTGTIGEEEKEPYGCDIRFEKEEKENNFTIFLNYSNEMPMKECTYNWTYNLTVIPVDIKFEKGSVEREVGNWSDTFNYSVWMNASVWMNGDLTVTLNVYDPYREPEPWRPLGKPDEPYMKEEVNKPKKLNWTNKKPFENYCAGQSKFYFEYCIEEFKGESPVYLGPYLGDIPKPPEFDNGIPNPNVTIYCNWSKSSTPCNYSVNVSTEDEYKVRLLVKDPVSNEWIPKGKPKDVSRETKNITWTNITPFESLNIDNITQYIGNVNISNFTFKYNEYPCHKKFPGPEIVAAFKEPRIELEPGDEEINYNDTFYYNVNVTACRNLSVTLQYFNGTEWVCANKTDSTKDYIPSEGEKTLKWTCIANETWEKVKMEVEVKGIKKPIDVY